VTTLQRNIIGIISLLKQYLDIGAFLLQCVAVNFRIYMGGLLRVFGSSTRIDIGYPDKPLLDHRIVRGGEVKLEHLRDEFRHSRTKCECLYLVSSALPINYLYILKNAKQRRHLVIWNQNGVAFPAWAPNSYLAINNRLRYGLLRADKVIYQSKFCMETTHRWVGKARNYDVIYNPVDTSKFTPAKRVRRPITLLLCGTQQAKYRVLSAIDVLQRLIGRGQNIKLIIAGRLNWNNSEEQVGKYISQCKLDKYVQLIGEFSRNQAREIFLLGDILLHTKYNDPCPTVVLEALSCGLPIIGSDSGGLPELVSESSGILVPVPKDDYYTDHSIPPDAGANAVEEVISAYDWYAAAARQQAVESFDLKRWLFKHEEIFGGRILEDYRSHP
jgi:glycosyltransferase involved in cell wall biosynthesis